MLWRQNVLVLFKTIGIVFNFCHLYYIISIIFYFKTKMNHFKYYNVLFLIYVVSLIYYYYYISYLLDFSF